MSSNTDTELLTEHFGYPPVSLIDDVINSVNILAERALNSVEQGLLNASPAALGFKKAAKKQQQPQDPNDVKVPDTIEAARTEIESGTHQLETLLCASIDRNFDKFEIYVLRNILCVRPPGVRDWIRLSHYEGLDFSVITPETTIAPTITNATTAEGGNGEGGQDGGVSATNPDLPTLEGINKLRRKLRESMRLNALLAAESARNESLLSDLRRLVGAPSTSPAIKKEKESSTSEKNHRSSSSGGAPPAAITVDGNNDEQNEQIKKESTSSPSSPSPFAFLHNKGDLKEAGPDTPLSTTAAFTLSQMHALRALSTSLRTMAPDLAVSTRPSASKPKPRKSRSSRSRSRSRSRGPSNEDDKSGDEEGDEDEEGGDEGEGEGRTKKKKSWRRERLEYVESATRRHLETVQGLELGRDGEVRDGEWQGEGRTLGRGEVEGLERVVSLLGAEDNGASAGGGNGTDDAVVVEEAEEGEEGGGAEEGGEEDADRMDES